ncbi:hypothetical protein SK128_001661 [Halocaridina rubra]|uniref:Uncharacterized protein n=1 Tax=Halocaridina rubra TaxID=373956 RepID=A0AAN8WYV8_HALRR
MGASPSDPVALVGLEGTVGSDFSVGDPRTHNEVRPGVVPTMTTDEERAEWWEDWVANASEENATIVGGNWTGDSSDDDYGDISIQFLASALTAVILGVMILATIVVNKKEWKKPRVKENRPSLLPPPAITFPGTASSVPMVIPD